ncbi:YggS family pyridoxal phosphate-dependent enzyme [Pseudoxanthomonas kaohsiungensis]|uniref:Pyridoxal phosphate homeostasis protein n=1 Tax=Pseudoxanthomonas kaohsiungensis TaxID=283923 RepID=A0ABW3LYV9_9GAMM|nr:YggS family pyridoxal phosphate-dependent enzyme [Pseudoxanthomonas kaohsiungensis]KAF1701712.1 YggS family pyridoxal phosphate-dependent enzyme [Pseudoxanthomonas kaohsiungensis]
MPADRLRTVLQRIQNAADAAGRPVPALLAVSKTQPADAVAALAAAGQQAFGENYVQEAAAKRAALAADHPGLQWHLIGHLQSNKAALAAEVFDWVQSVDRDSVIAALARHRAPQRPRLNVLIQVNVEGEPGKGGCPPGAIAGLAERVAAEPRLALRGLMSIPVPHADLEARRPAFARIRALFADLAARHPGVDTLSMGMSDDFPVAIAEGATMVRIGTALFGPRPH